MKLAASISPCFVLVAVNVAQIIFSHRKFPFYYWHGLVTMPSGTRLTGTHWARADSPRTARASDSPWPRPLHCAA